MGLLGRVSGRRSGASLSETEAETRAAPDKSLSETGESETRCWTFWVGGGCLPSAVACLAARGLG